ncbi:hypothetical protein KA005_81560 [bacterium]|nr:hypothetical protein [bacterium]
MKKLLEIAKHLRQGFKKAEVRLSNKDKDRINNEMLNLTGPDFDSFFDELFQDCENISSGFYKRVSNLQFYVGFGSKSESVVSRLWIHAYQKLGSNEAKENFLNEILNDDTRYFWNFIRSLPGFCSKIELSASFAAGWFYGLAERVKNDLAGGGVYDGIESYASSFPSSALEIFNIYESQLSDETTRGLASFILGHIRCQRKETVQAIDDRLESSDDVDKRVCYYNSILASYKNGVITLKQLSTILDQMLSDSSEQVKDVAFWTVKRGLITRIANFGEFGITWFDTNCAASISGESKYHVISCMWHLCSSSREANTIDYQDANRIIAKILPVPNEHLGTLDELSNYLCYGIKGADEFTETILGFIPDGITNLFCLFEHDRFEHFRSELSKVDLTHLITELIFSGDPKKCKLGFLFLGHSKFTPYTSKTLIKAKEENIFMALKQLMKERNLNQTIAKKVQFLEPFFRKVCKELQNDFVNEIVIQAVNYSQGCLKEIKRFGRSKLIKTIIARAEKYFENFKKAQNSSANGFNFPGYGEACLQANKRFNARVKKLVEEKSVFMSLVTKVQLIYGREFSFSVGQSVSDASPMAHFEKSMELPRLELIDPEGMVIRRLRARG